MAANVAALAPLVASQAKLYRDNSSLYRDEYGFCTITNVQLLCDVEIAMALCCIQTALAFSRNPDYDNKVSGIASIEQVSRSEGGLNTIRMLNGDQSNQGRQLSMAPSQIDIYHVVLYVAERTPLQK
jgi:hypothetical protein